MPATSTQYTQGPWSQSELSPNSVWAEKDGENVCIAICNPKALGVSKQIEWEANARLIAAAPELLAQCKKLLDVITRDCDSMAFVHEVDVAQEAIAKAEGK